MSSSSSTSTTQIPKWNFKADYVETCNCDFGCPCNFSGFPTYGFCRTLILFHIRSGSCGNAKLDGLDFFTSLSWPKAIHEGNNNAQLFVTNKANEEQRQAMISIVSGQAKGDGPFALFAGTFKYFLESHSVDININIDEKRVVSQVPGVMDVQLESFKNPVT